MTSPDPEIMSRFIQELEENFSDRGGVGVANLIDHTVLSPDPLIAELVFSMLVWESSIEHALRAVTHIQDGLIDLNELRVCTPEELTRILPSRYPRSLERSQRLIRILNCIFMNENRLSLAHLHEMTKRDVIAYFRSLDGMPPFVSSRVILLGLGWHAFPVDDWLSKQLAKHGITDTKLDLYQQTQRLERLVRASDSLHYYTLIEHWAQSQRITKSAPSSETNPLRSLSKGSPTRPASKESS